MIFTAVVLAIGPALILRACRPGGVPKRRLTWFDIAR